MKWFGLAALLGCNSGKAIKQGSITSGPFEISWEVTSSRSGAWFNNGGDFNARDFTSWFSIKYKGKTVEVPAFDQYWGTNLAGTSKEKPVKYFWQALFIKDAPRPAILAGIHSMHLITEENGQLKIIPLHEQDGGFATYQWLDSDNGQPGRVNGVYLGDDSGNSRFLSGGQYLIVNSKVILDIKTFDISPLSLHTYGESQQKLLGYNATNSAVVQFSPQKTQVVLIGSRDNPENRLLYQYGLVAIDFKKNTGYAVPFDRTDARFFSVWDADQKWLNTYFQWSVDKSGEERIALRKFDRLPYWQGRWDHNEETGEPVGYNLRPVEASMLPAFLNFIRKEITIKAETTEKTPYQDYGSTEELFLVNTTLTTENDTLYVYYNPTEQNINLHSLNDAHALFKQLGEGFDREMMKGKYQEFFGRYK